MSFLKKQLGKSIDHFISEKESYETYLLVLEKYWERDSESVLDSLSRAIEEQENLEDCLPLYRLWVEQLAELGDRASLGALQKHFLTISGYLEDKTSFQALRGLVHLELEEVESCSHLFELLSKCNENPYALEFCEKYRRRFAEDGEEPSFLLQTKKAVLDYFHWKTLAETHLITGRFLFLDKVLSYVEKSFPSSPLTREFNFYKSLDEESFPEAKKSIQSLLKKYPRREDYQFLYAYTLSVLGEYDNSNSVLEKLQARGRLKDDPDFHSLMAYNAYLSSYGDVNSEKWAQAEHHFLQAEKHLSHLGLPTKDSLLSLSLMSRHERSLTKEKRGERTEFSYWLYHLKATDFSRLMSSQEEEVYYLYETMGSPLREGDLVFATSLENLSQEMRLGAVYQVVGTPVWEHGKGYVTTLELLSRFESSIPLSESFMRGDSPTFESHSEKLRKGLYLLSSEGLKILSSEMFKSVEEEKLAPALKALQLKAV